MTQKTKRRYDWRPDKPDHRDFKYALHMLKATPSPALPTSADLRPYCSPVVDQGDIGSCTGNSIAGALEFMELREMRFKAAGSELFNPTKFASFSRLFIYYNERVIEGTVDQDAGAEIRDGIKVIATVGACRESVWQYSDSLVYTKPTTAAYTEAAQHKVGTYYRISDLTSMKHCLSSGYPFVFGFTVYDNFESDETAATGILTMPGPNDTVIGGHAVLCVGYDDAKQQVIVRNSWGPDWGDKGYFYMPYAYISNTDLADDMWTVRK